MQESAVGYTENVERWWRTGFCAQPDLRYMGGCVCCGLIARLQVLVRAAGQFFVYPLGVFFDQQIFGICAVEAAGGTIFATGERPLTPFHHLPIAFRELKKGSFHN